MKIYKCNDCKKEFFRTKAIEEPRGEFWGSFCSETVYVCPYCESEDLEESDYDGEEEEEDEDEGYFY